MFPPVTWSLGMLSSVDWHALIAPDMSPLEIFARGTLVYLGLFVMMRVVLKRQSGALGITDLLVVVLIADAAQNAMAGDYRSVPDGLLLVATILFWCYTLDWLGYRFPAIERLLSPSPLPIVRDGQILRANLRRELITLDELRSFLREQVLTRSPMSRKPTSSPTAASVSSAVHPATTRLLSQNAVPLANLASLPSQPNFDGSVTDADGSAGSV